jgi:hypothetical protein
MLRCADERVQEDQKVMGAVVFFLMLQKKAVKGLLKSDHSVSLRCFDRPSMFQAMLYALCQRRSLYPRLPHTILPRTISVCNLIVAEAVTQPPDTGFLWSYTVTLDFLNAGAYFKQA